MTGEVNRKGIEDSGDVTGVFFSSVKPVFSYTTHSAGGSGTKIVFKASDGNSMYSGEKLQVSALQVLTCIKI